MITTKKRLASADRFVPDADWAQDANDHDKFLQASLSTDREVKTACRRLSNVLESLCALTPEQRRGFLVAAKERVDFWDSHRSPVPAGHSS